MRLEGRIGRVGLRGLVLLAMAVPAVAQSTMTIMGEKQGAFKGESVRRGGEIGVVSVVHERIAPERARGMRGHNPVVVTREVGAASPQLFQAYSTREVLPEVALNIGSQSGGAGAGKMRLAQRVVLRNATISGMRKVGNQEEITFNYEAIAVTSVDGSVSTTDDWTAQDQ